MTKDELLERAVRVLALVEWAGKVKEIDACPHCSRFAEHSRKRIDPQYHGFIGHRKSCELAAVLRDAKALDVKG